jgi:hypothetical protein
MSNNTNNKAPIYIDLNQCIGAPDSIQRIKNIAPYLQKAREYFKIYTKDDILLDVDSDTEDSELNEEQIVERKRRATSLKNVLDQFNSGSLPDLSSFNPKDYDTYTNSN